MGGSVGLLASREPEFPDDAKDRFIDDYLVRHVQGSAADIADLDKAFAFFRQDQFRYDRTRLCETFLRIRRHACLEGLRVAETGYRSGVSLYLATTGIPVCELEGDFRYSIAAQNNSVDALFSFEVFEHIKDQESDNLDDIVLFNYSGVRAYASEMFRVLAPGGRLYMTTPNAASLKILVNAIEGRAPWLFPPHVKEYTPAEVVEIMESVGFKPKHVETMFCSFFLQDREPLFAQYLDPIGASRKDRGDVAFFVFEKINPAMYFQLPAPSGAG